MQVNNKIGRPLQEPPALYSHFRLKLLDRITGSGGVEFETGALHADVVSGVGDGPLVHRHQFPEPSLGHRSRITDLEGRQQVFVEPQVRPDDPLFPGNMIGQERKRAQDNRLFIVPVDNLVDELRLSLVDFRALADHRVPFGRRVLAPVFGLERIEHAVEVVSDRHETLSVLEFDEIIIHRSLFDTAPVDRHRQDLLFHDLLEPGLVEVLGRIHEDPHDERAVIFTLETVDLLARQTHLQAQVVEVGLVAHLLGTDGDDLDAVGCLRIQGVNPELGRHEDLFLDFLGGDDGRVVTDDHPVLADIRFDAAGACNPFEPCLEGHGTAVALDGTEILHLNRLDFLRFTPGLVDGRQFEHISDTESKNHQQHRQQSRDNLPDLLAVRFLRYAHPERIAVAGCDAFSAEGAVHVVHLALAGGDIDVVRAVLRTEPAVRTSGIIFYDVQNLHFGFCTEDFEQVANQAEQPEQDEPRQGQADLVENEPEGEESGDPQPELERVGSRAKRADVSAPELIHKESTDQGHRNRDDGHPERDLTLEPGGYGIVRVEVLAEEFAGGCGHIHDPEKQQVLDNPQRFIEHGAVPDAQFFDLETLAKFRKQILHRSDRAEIAAEQFAEENDSDQQGDSHHDLQRGHAAGQRTPNRIGGQRLDASERAVCLRIHLGGFLEDLPGQAGEEEYKQRKCSPLKEVPRPIPCYCTFLTHDS